MSPRKGKKGLGQRATPSGLSPGAESAVMTLQEVADYPHCHYVTVYGLIRATGLPAFRLSGNWRFLKSEVEKWIAAGGGKPSETAPAKTHGGRRGPKPKPKTTRR
jgi:excisionase family DNA binding protein